MRQFKIVILLMLMLISITAYAGNNVVIHFNYPADTVYVGIANTLEIYIENDDVINAMSLGLEFSGYSGIITWNSGYGSVPPMNVEEAGLDAFANGVMIAYGDLFDSYLPDSILFGGVMMPTISDGLLPYAYPELRYTMEFEIPPGEPLGQICVDNIIYPPAGEWLFYESYEVEYAPDFNGCVNTAANNPDCSAICFPVAEAPGPVADFSFTPDSGDYPLAVDFTDLSQYSPTDWFWTFGDGDYSFEQNPSHTYLSEGTFYPKLVVSNDYGTDSMQSATPVIVTSPPVVPGVTVTCMAVKETVSGITDTIPFTITNTGEDSDSYSFTAVDSLGWFISPTYLLFGLEGGGDTIINVAVMVPNELASGIQNKLTATVQSQILPQVSGSASCVLIVTSELCGDVNLDGMVNVSDAVYLINYIFMGGPSPCHPE
jgi:PKD repeat protein